MQSLNKELFENAPLYMDNLMLLKNSTINITCKETAYLAKPDTNTIISRIMRSDTVVHFIQKFV